MSVKKKRLFTVVGLILLMVVVGVLYMFVPKGKEAASTDETEATEAPSITVETVDKNTVTELSMKTSDETVVLQKNDDTWNFKGDKKSPVNTELVDTMLTSLAPVTAVKELSLSDGSLADYGLDKPSLEVTATTSDGKSYTYTFGIEVPVVGGYYGQTSDNTKLYALNASIYTAFDHTKNSLMQIATAPEITADYITYINVDNRSGEDFEAEVVDEKDRVDSLSKWNVNKPYIVPVSVNVQTFNTLLDTYTTYNFASCEGYGIKDLGKYGLDKPACTITMKYYTVKSSGAEATATPAATGSSEIAEKDREYHNFSVKIGKKTKDGYYVQISGSDGVFVIATDAVKNYMEPDVYTYVDHAIYATLATKIKGFDVYTGGETIKVTRKATGETKDGVEQNEWYINNKKVDLSGDKAEETFLTPYSKGYLLETSGKISSTVKPKSDKEVLKIVYHEDKKDVTISYLPYDGENFYRVKKNSEMLFLTDKRAVDDVAKAFAGMLDLVK